MATATWYLRSYSLTMCQRRHDCLGLGFRRMTTPAICATENRGPRQSDADVYVQEDTVGYNAQSKEPEPVGDHSVLEEHPYQLSNVLAQQPVEGTEEVDMLLPSVNMYTNIEDMLTG